MSPCPVRVLQVVLLKPRNRARQPVSADDNAGMTYPLSPLRDFVREMTELVGAGAAEDVLLADGHALLAGLISDDSWLPEAFAAPRSDRYAQYLLHCDPLERFSMVSFVWGPGQRTPIHDHTVWGLVGVLRGAERSDAFELSEGVPVDLGQHTVMSAGEVDAVSPTLGDWHRVTNVSEAVSVSIHVYGGNVGRLRRHRYDEDNGRLVDFVSGYDNVATPNLWGGPAAVPC